jgi:hypothetical protein
LGACLILVVISFTGRPVDDAVFSAMVVALSGDRVRNSRSGNVLSDNFSRSPKDNSVDCHSWLYSSGVGVLYSIQEFLESEIEISLRPFCIAIQILPL